MNLAHEVPFVIVGGGQAGGWIAKTLRREGFPGPITLLGAEPHAPYERPPLSKATLSGGTTSPTDVVLSEEEARSLDIDMRLADPVANIDRYAKTVRCRSGATIPYDKLFLTTGSSPRVPDWYQPHTRMHLLRTIDDAIMLRGALTQSSKLLIVGGGWIGLEVASTARRLGLEVIVVEAQPHLCMRSLPPQIGTWLAEYHRREGVQVITSQEVKAVHSTVDGVTVRLADGRLLTADIVLAGIGNIPEVTLAAAAGLVVANGIVVDSKGRSSDPDIFAAGDVASFKCQRTGVLVRRESWANAQNQAIAVARSALGATEAYDELPWLWSEQFGVNIQMAGYPELGVTVLKRVASEGDAVTWVALDGDGSPVGVVSVSDAAAFRKFRKLITDRSTEIPEEWRSDLVRDHLRDGPGSRS